MDNQTFEPMCGHAVIGTVTTLIETGMLEKREVTLDTPAGLVRAKAEIHDGLVASVSFENMPAFVWQLDLPLQVPGLGDLLIDVAFGGNFFVLVEASQVNLELVPANAGRLAELGMRILAAANQQVKVRHPAQPHIEKIIDLRFHREPGLEGADGRNLVVLGDHMVDRSPCGTGTCAELAVRYARGQVGLRQPFVTESIIGTRFTGQVIAETIVGDRPAVVPRITGSAYLTGWHQFVLDPRDPFPAGFKLG